MNNNPRTNLCAFAMTCFMVLTFVILWYVGESIMWLLGYIGFIGMMGMIDHVTMHERGMRKPYYLLVFITPVYLAVRGWLNKQWGWIAVGVVSGVIWVWFGVFQYNNIEYVQSLEARDRYCAEINKEFERMDTIRRCVTIIRFDQDFAREYMAYVKLNNGTTIMVPIEFITPTEYRISIWR